MNDPQQQWQVSSDRGEPVPPKFLAWDHAAHQSADAWFCVECLIHRTQRTVSAERIADTYWCPSCVDGAA